MQNLTAAKFPEANFPTANLFTANFPRTIPLTLFVSRNLILIYLSLSGSLDSLLCSAMRWHPRSGIFSIDVTDASGSAIIFVKQGLSLYELSTSSLSSLDSYFDYAEVNISLNDSSSLSFLNIYAPPICSSPKDSRTNFFSPSLLPFYVQVEGVEFSCFRFRFHRKRTASASASTSLVLTVTYDFA